MRKTVNRNRRNSLDSLGGEGGTQWLIKNACEVPTVHKDYGGKLISHARHNGKGNTTRLLRVKPHRGWSDGEYVTIESACKLFPTNWIFLLIWKLPLRRVKYFAINLKTEKILSYQKKICQSIQQYNFPHSNGKTLII